ncbi:MAG TPA: carboxypeptidase-like regulatory domain-containing protein, partial [Usitatibacter sp.]|nr:carboxypeptidase-like regulatory domain-containing protein [Usitatibacter sp.]
MRLHLALTAAILAAAAAFSVRALGEPGALVCGGIGADERARLAEETRGANLALELFIAKRGDYVAGADVTVQPLDGTGHGIEASADGPICYIELPPGRYRIEAEFNGVTRSARAIVREHARRPVRVALAFPEEAARGDLGP